MMNLKRAGIVGIGSYLPEKIVTNKDLEKIVDTSDEWIVSRTGIQKRRITEDGMTTSDMATEAAKRALEMANLKPEDLDLIIVGTVTPDMMLPSTACIVQKNLGAYPCAAMDLEAACSGFVYGITVGKQFIETGMYKNVLVIGAENLSKILDWTDRNTCVLFGDGAGAAVLSEVQEGGIISASLGADGKGGEFLCQPAGGAKLPATEETVKERLHTLKMSGSDVFKFAVRIMADSSRESIEKAGLTVDEIDLLVPHQANIRIIESSAKRLGISMDKVFVNLNEYGNMSAASIPVALDEAYRSGRLKKGDNLTIVGFGGGLTWGSSCIKWSI